MEQNTGLAKNKTQSRGEQMIFFIEKLIETKQKTNADFLVIDWNDYSLIKHELDYLVDTEPDLIPSDVAEYTPKIKGYVVKFIDSTTREIMISFFEERETVTLQLRVFGMDFRKCQTADQRIEVYEYIEHKRASEPHNIFYVDPSKASARAYTMWHDEPIELLRISYL